MLGIELYYTVMKPEIFDFVPQPMLETRYFILIVPDKISRSSYIAFKLVLTACYSLVLLKLYYVGLPASFKWWRIAADRAAQNDYLRPTDAEVAVNDYLPEETDSELAAL